MKIIQSLFLNILIGLVVFTLFLLIFEYAVVIPPVLQVLGRSHPLLLHFPIVLLVLAWGLACFQNRLVLPAGFAVRMVYALLFASVVSAAFTVVAGLLLAQEGGYEGAYFLWHKWLGVALLFLSVLLLAYHRRAMSPTGGYRLLFRAGLSILLVILVVAGHFGASLTHGGDFLIEPLRNGKQKTLDMATAAVFPDLVYPILEAKCLSCHSSTKAKGGLVLSDTAALMRGGESGPVLVRGAAGESLIIERLLLDLDHEHRMPPKGRPQLKAEELALISAWVASGADFNIPLASLPSDDTIRRLALALYPIAEDEYDFPAADAEIVRSLNTPYRVVRPVAESSPALSVSFFGKAFYTAESLEALKPVNRQVVSITLSGMPLTEADRDVLRTFTNLRELKLNGTPVDDTWCDILSDIPKLHTLSLSSTSITEAGLMTLLSAPSLRTVYVWNTAIDANAVEKLQRQYTHTSIELGYVDDGQTVLPLNDPIITPLSKFFRDSLWVVLSHPVPGVELRYTTDGSEPDSIHSSVYREPFLVSESTSVRVKGYKPGWISSSEAVRTFHPSGHPFSSVVLETVPSTKYKGRGSYTLHDLESGGSNHADGKWLGFYGESMVAALFFDKAIGIGMVGVSVKQDYPIHIYPPQQVEVWGGANAEQAELLGQLQPELFTSALQSRVIEVPVSGRDIRYLRIEAKPYVPIPVGYPAAGNPAWIFIDEIIVR